MPKKHAKMHRNTLRKTLAKALMKLPCCSILSVSNEKVEKVVKPPRKPTNMVIRISSDMLIRSNNIKDKKPINKDPNTLTSKVP